MNPKAILATFVILYAMEREDPLLTACWPRWKRRIIFNPLMDRYHDLICVLLKRVG